MKITTKLVIDNRFTFVTQKRFAGIFVFLISSFLEIDFEINISDKKSRRFDLQKVETSWFFIANIYLKIFVFLSSFCVSSLILRNNGKDFQVVYIF